MGKLKWVLTLLFIIFSTLAQAGDLNRITYQGRVVKPDGRPLDVPTNFRFRVVSPNQCVLWQEDQVLDLTSTFGAFTAVIGNGTNSVAGSHAFKDIFDNTRTLTGLDGCLASGGTFGAALDDDRSLEVSFNDGLGSQDLPAMAIKNVPFASFANMSASTRTILGKPLSLFSTATTDGQVLRFDSVSDSWIAGGAGSIGISYVELGLPTSLFTNGAGISTNGTLGATLNVQAVNSVFAGPTGTMGGVPTFRNLVVADIPGLPASQITAGTLAAARGGTGLDGSVAANGQILIGNGSGFSMGSISAGSNVSILNSPGGIQISASTSLGSTGVAPGSYGSASWIPNFIVDAFGRLTSAGSIEVAIDANQVVAGTLATARLGIIPATSISGITSSQWSDVALGINLVTGSVGIGVGTPITKLDVAGAIKIANDTATCVASFAGAIRYTGGMIQYCDGVTAGWVTLGVSGSGLQSLNGLNSNNQIFALNSVGTLAAFTSAGSVHTLSIPMAATSGAVGGLISNAEYLTLTNGTIPASRVTLATTGIAAGTVGNATYVPQIGYDVYGRIVSMGSTALSFMGLNGTVGVAQGGTGLNGSSAANGSLLIGNGSGFSLGTLTYSNGMVVTNSAGTIHLSTTAQTTNATLSIVARDASGNFAAGTGRFNGVEFNNAGAIVGISNPMGATYSMVLPANMGSPGQVLSTNGTSALSWISPSAGVNFPLLSTTLGSVSTPVYSFLADPDTGMYSPGPGLLTLTANGNSQVNISSDGRMGVGPLVNGYELAISRDDVQTEVLIENTTTSGGAKYPGMTIANYMNGIGAGHPSIELLNANGTKAAPTFMNNAQFLGSMSFGAYAGGGSTSGGAVIYAQAPVTHSNGSTPSDLVFTTTPVGSMVDVDRLRITAGGSIGIGTATPAGKLHVVSGAGALPVMTTDDDFIVQNNLTAGAEAGISVIGGTSGYSSIGFGDSLSQYRAWIGSDNLNSSLRLGSSGSERVRIDAGGNVGINTSNPTRTLQVAGDLRFQVSGPPRSWRHSRAIGLCDCRQHRVPRIKF